MPSARANALHCENRCTDVFHIPYLAIIRAKIQRDLGLSASLKKPLATFRFTLILRRGWRRVAGGKMRLCSNRWPTSRTSSASYLAP